MPLAYSYHDPYLAALVTDDRETRALADVGTYRNDFTADWLERLTRLRAYVITCQESQKAADDLFSVKLAQYQKEFDKSLPLANAAADQALVDAGTSEPGMASLVSIELYRA